MQCQMVSCSLQHTAAHSGAISARVSCQSKVFNQSVWPKCLATPDAIYARVFGWNRVLHTAAHSGAISARSLWLKRCLAKVKVSCKSDSQKCLAISHVVSFAQMVSCQSKDSCESVLPKCLAISDGISARVMMQDVISARVISQTLWQDTWARHFTLVCVYIAHKWRPISHNRRHLCAIKKEKCFAKVLREVSGDIRRHLSKRLWLR